MILFILLTCLARELLTIRAACITQDDKGVQSQDVEIQFSKSNCSVSCKLNHVNMTESKTIYWTKLLKQINGSFHDIVHKRLNLLNGQTYVIHEFNCTDAESRFYVNRSNIDEPSLVFRLYSNKVRESDSGIYKCAVNSGVDIYWNKVTIDFAGCHGNPTNAQSLCTKAVLLYIIISLLFIMIATTHH